MTPDLEIKPRILIVDDELLIRKILSRYLGERNYEIETADNGRTALEILAKSEFDCVITDLRMPEMGGSELLQIMSDRYPTLPKIVLTGYGTNDDIILALKTGAYDFLTKPITDFKILDHSIERAIDRKRLNDEKNRYLGQLQQINEIISMLNSGKNTEDVFNALNVSLKRIIPFNRLALTRYDHDSDRVTTKLVASDREIMLKSGDSFCLAESSLKNTYESRDVLNIPDLEEFQIQNPQSHSTQMLLKEGMRSSLVLPLIVNNLIRGFLIFASEQKDSFTRSHVDFLHSIVGQISLSIQRGELLYEIEQHTKNLEHLVELRTREVIKTQKTTIFALSKLAETRDPETGDHLDRMRNYSILLAQVLKYSGNHSEITNQYLRDLYDSSILHDIGKVGIPDSILLKNGFLTRDEFEQMQNHTVIGYQSLRSASREMGNDSFLNMAMDVTLHHHERWDGGGYPKKLKGNDIPLSARIVSIADIYDALTSKRPYKDAFDHDKAIGIMKDESYRFDPEIFSIFLENEDEFNMIRQRYKKVEVYV